jgi:3D (Asp-Asp-Asp) domain-containing protein
MSPPRVERRSLRHPASGLVFAVAFASGCALYQPAERRQPAERGQPGERSLVVTSTAYNSIRSQTDGNPSLGAWGDRLRPGMRVIAVSHDLLELGLTRGTPVRVEGLPGEYTVLDKMGRRWRKRIDVYMGHDVHAARQWGRRQVRIFWRPRPDD